MPTPTATIYLPYSALDDVILRGPRSAQPLASAVVAGTLYAVTDEGNIVERSSGTAWEAYSPLAGGGGAAVLPYRWATALTEPVTLSHLACNAAYPYTAATKVWIHVKTINNEDVYWGLMLVHTGAALLVQDTTDHTYYAEFQTDAEPVDKGTYIEYAVHWVGNGSALANNETVLVRVGTPTGLVAHHATHEPGGSDALANLSATTLTSGTLPDARLSANVPLLNASNVFTGVTQELGQALRLRQPSGAANQRVWQLYEGMDGLLYWQVTNDAYVSAAPPYPAILSRVGSLTLAGDLVEKNRATPMGHWTSVPYSAGIFTAYPSGTWTVDAGDVVTLSYMLVGKTMWLTYLLYGVSVSGAPTELRLQLPGGFTCAQTTVNAAAYREPTPWATGYCSPAGGAPYVRFQKDPDSGTAWAATTNNTFIYGTAVVPLQ